ATPSTGSVPWLVIVLLIMAFIVSVTGVVYRSRSRQAVAMSVKNRSSNGSKRLKQQGQAPGARRQQKPAPKKISDKAGANEQALLQQLLELDKAYEAGKMKKGEYQERRAAIKAQLRAQLSEKVGT
ncbi:MAG TPA: hypothetical protein VIY29_16595, partial [Ktedonobacteraceae bacterium]